MILLYLLIMLPIALESIPISSSGHAQLIEQLWFRWFHEHATIPHDFDHFLHGPIVFILLLFFYERWIFLLKNRVRCWPLIKKLLLFGIIIESITALGYVVIVLAKMKALFPLEVGFFISALLLYSLRFCKPHHSRALTYHSSAALGCVQAFALLPGISRFGSTFVVARWMGFSSRRAFELSFLIEWPISCAAFLKGSYSLYTQSNVQILNLTVYLSILMASVIALLGFVGMQWIINKRAEWLFSAYLLILSFITMIYA